MSLLNDLFMVLKFGWPFIILFVFVGAKMKWKPWVIDVVILEKRGNNIIKSNDRAARYQDKFTKLTGYKLLKSKDTIPVVEYNWILHNNHKHTNFLERLVNMLRPTQGTLFLYKYGSKQYKPMPINTNENADMKLVSMQDKNGQDVYVQQYTQFDPRGSLDAIDIEVFDWDNMNFVIQEIRATHERRQKEGQWMKTILMPVLIIAAAAMVAIVMMKFGMDFGQTLKAGAAPASNLANQPAVTPNIPIIGDAFVPK